ncbi:MAG TPA: alpha/beta fold hydrolase [Candidatus Sulfotelmatobacter sp.]
MDSTTIETVSFPSESRQLAGRIFSPSLPEAGRRAVFFVHGQKSSQRGYEDRALLASRDLDAMCLTFDLSGHGDDAGNYDKYSVVDHLQDVIAAFDYLVRHKDVDHSRVGVCGASYGAYLAALLTARRDIKRLILRAPSLATDVGFPNREGRSAAPGEIPDGFDSLAILSGYPGEVLIIESERDEVIPQSHIAAYRSACSHAEHEVIPGATHGISANASWEKAFVLSIVRWFRDL